MVCGALMFRYQVNLRITPSISSTRNRCGAGQGATKVVHLLSRLGYYPGIGPHFANKEFGITKFPKMCPMLKHFSI